MAVSLRRYPVIAGKDAQRLVKKIEQNQQNMKQTAAVKLANLKKA